MARTPLMSLVDQNIFSLADTLTQGYSLLTIVVQGIQTIFSLHGLSRNAVGHI